MINSEISNLAGLENLNIANMPAGTTEKAFKHFVDHVYPNIKPKPLALRVIVSKFNKKEKRSDYYVSEEAMAEILIEHGYGVLETKVVPVSWDVPEENQK